MRLMTEDGLIYRRDDVNRAYPKRKVDDIENMEHEASFIFMDGSVHNVTDKDYEDYKKAVDSLQKRLEESPS